MMNSEILPILNEIMNKEHSFRDITRKKHLYSRFFTLEGKDVGNEYLYGKVIAFILYAKYKNVISFRGLCNKNDVTEALKISNHANISELLDIWTEIGDDYPYLNKFLDLINSYDFAKYADSEHERVFANWCNSNYLFDDSEFVCDSSINGIIYLNTINDCQKQLDISMSDGKILVVSNNCNFQKYILESIPSNANITFYDYDYGLYNSFKIDIKINSLFLDCYSNICLSKDIIGPYDGVVVYTPRSKELETWEDYFEMLNNGGFLIALEQKISHLSEQFYRYSIPLMLESNSGINILCKKIDDKSNIVRYGQYFTESDYDFGEKDYWVKKLVECIKNSISTDFYQILTKQDFKVLNKVRFQDVKRLPDQIHFVWRKKKEIISLDEEVEWLYDSHINEECIIEQNQLSDNPFKTKVTNKYYLTSDIYRTNEKHHILEDCTINRDNDGFSCAYEIRNNAAETFEKCYSNNVGIEEKYKPFENALCCRVITHSTLLYAFGKILKIEASPEAPVCFRNYLFYFEPDSFSVGCSICIDSIKISSDYDENFIIYQLLNEKGIFNEYLLVAPSKEEQHTYFINKRLDYLSKYQPVVDEIEGEIQQSVSESQAYITGLGFTNFRRFVNLPLIPLAGVNILVGGNNAGKSSFVKGLLLMFDNIKNMTIKNTENNLLTTNFQYDANNFHDVHIGTFDRAYSNNAISLDKRIMSFTMSFAHFEMTLVVSPVNMDDSTNVPIASITVKDHKRNAQFTFDLENLRTSAFFTIGEKRVEYFLPSLKFKATKYGEHKIVSLLRSLILPKENVQFTATDEEQVKVLQSKAGFILEIADELQQIIDNTTIEYIYAHGVNQKVLFNYNDKNDYMAQTLHDFMNEKIGGVEHDFICNWLSEFGIGIDYDIHSIGGEAYIIEIKDKSNNMTYLADMGMGANQLVILILRLAIIIHKHRIGGNHLYRPTIVIEEPEQNMHPEFQSKLATLFHYVNDIYGFNFIVETHSEYLVRRTQVIVAHKKYKDQAELNINNPFKVYYFPCDKGPYEMQYRTDGNFSNEFGKGFYDEANNLLFEII